MLIDVTAQIEDRQIEELLVDQEEGVEDAPRAAIAIGEGMHGLELVVRRRHADERIDFIVAVQELFEFRQLLPQQRLPLGRRVDDLAAGLTGKCGTRNLADV